MFCTQVVQTAGNFHCAIRDAIFGITQNVLDDATAFHAGNCMFHTHANPC